MNNNFLNSLLKDATNPSKKFFDKESIMGFGKFINNLFVPFVCILMVILIINIRDLPHKMAAQMSPDMLPDTVRETVVVTETARLETKSDFLYIDCKTIDKSFKINDKFEYSIKYPKEIFSGYLTKIQDRQGGKYYLWTKQDLEMDNLALCGYYFTDNITSFQEVNPIDKDKCEYLQVVYPVVESKID